MNIYLLRHGESQANRGNFFAGHTDIDLTDKGYQQAGMAAEYITTHLKIDKIYASDLVRAYHTAVPTAEKLGLEIRKEPRFREIYAGDWEGKLFDDILSTFPDSYGTWIHDIGKAHPDQGESVEDLGKRILQCLEEVARENPDHNVLIATHATPIRAIRCVLTGHPICDMKDVPWAANASLTTVSYEEGKLQLLEYGLNTYLGDMVTRFTGKV